MNNKLWQWLLAQINRSISCRIFFNLFFLLYTFIGCICASFVFYGVICRIAHKCAFKYGYYDNALWCVQLFAQICAAQLKVTARYATSVTMLACVGWCPPTQSQNKLWNIQGWHSFVSCACLPIQLVHRIVYTGGVIRIAVVAVLIIIVIIVNRIITIIVRTVAFRLLARGIRTAVRGLGTIRRTAFVGITALTAWFGWAVNPAICRVLIGLSVAATLDADIFVLFTALAGGTFLHAAGRCRTLGWLMNPTINRIRWRLSGATTFGAGMLGCQRIGK